MGLFSEIKRKKFFQNIGVSIRSMDVKSAKTRNFHDPFLDEPHSPEEVLERFYEKVDQLNLKVVHKKSRWGRFSRMSTTYPTQIRVGTTFKHMDTFEQALVGMHELTHSRQWKCYGIKDYARGYASNPRFGWRMECSAYGESIWAAVSMGEGKEKWLEKYVYNRDDTLIKGYLLLRPLKAAHVHKYTDEAMRWYLKKADKAVNG